MHYVTLHVNLGPHSEQCQAVTGSQAAEASIRLLRLIQLVHLIITTLHKTYGKFPIKGQLKVHIC